MEVETASGSVRECPQKLEERRSDSDIKDALESIDIFRLHLAEELGKMY